MASLIRIILGLGLIISVFISHAKHSAAIAVRAKLQTGRGPKCLTQPEDLPLYSDPKLAAFKAFRVFDDFEG